MNIKQAYDWAEGFKLSFIKSIDIVKMMSIRQLKAIALKMNTELGLVICKATFGKVMSKMNKQELIDAIWFVRSIQLAAPKGNFDFQRLTQRIFAMVCDPNTEWETTHTHYFGFKKDANGTAEQNAFRFHQKLLAKGACYLAAMRKADKRLAPYGFEYEVKVWGIKPAVLENLISRDTEPVPITIGTKFIVTDDPTGWLGAVGELVQDDGTHIWGRMDHSPGGKVRLKKSQIKMEDEVNNIETWLSICQKMYDNCKSSKAVNAIVGFIQRKGFEVINGKVEVRF